MHTPRKRHRQNPFQTNGPTPPAGGPSPSGGASSGTRKRGDFSRRAAILSGLSWAGAKTVAKWASVPVAAAAAKYVDDTWISPNHHKEKVPTPDNQLLGKELEVLSATPDMQARELTGHYTTTSNGGRRVTSSSKNRNSTMALETGYPLGGLKDEQTCAFFFDVKVDFPVDGVMTQGKPAHGFLEIIGSTKGDSTEKIGSSLTIDLHGTPDGNGVLIGAVERSSYFGGRFEFHWDDGPVGGFTRRTGVKPMLSENGNFIGAPDGNLRVGIFQRNTKRERWGQDILAADDHETIVVVLDGRGTPITVIAVDNLGELHGIGASVNGGDAGRTAAVTIGAAVSATDVDRDVFGRLTKDVSGDPMARRDIMSVLRGTNQQAGREIAQHGLAMETAPGAGMDHGLS
jgi:hypothetical protein